MRNMRNHREHGDAEGRTGRRTRTAFVLCALLILLCGAALVGMAMGEAAKTEAIAAMSYDWYFLPDKSGGQPAGNDQTNCYTEHDAYYVGPADEKVIYLTFDAGYENGYTERILDALKAEEVPAAFFVTGHYVRSAPEMVKRMTDEGHLVLNHSMNHKDLSELDNAEAVAAELSAIEEEYFRLTGKEMRKYYRPPEGRFSERLLEITDELGYTCFFWSFAYADWKNDDQPDPAAAKERILSRTHNGMIALLHSTSKTNSEILGDVLRRWKSMGYEFGTLDDFTKAGTQIIPDIIGN